MQVKKRFVQLMARRLIWLAFLFAFYGTSLAQKIPMDNYNIQNGLPQNTVSDIIQDSMGYIWFATQVGAARFDGYEFENFNSENGLPNDMVNCLMVDSQGRVWFGTEGGVAVLGGDGISTYATEDGLVDNRVDALLEDAQGNLWVTTQYGLSIITLDEILTYSQNDALVDNQIVDVYVDSKGWVHVATFPGLTVFQDPYTYKKVYEDMTVRDMLETGQREFWYGTQQNDIIAIKEDKESKLWINNTDENGTVLSLLEDHEGRIWVSTYEEGLFIYQNNKFRQVVDEHGAKIMAAGMFEDRHHRVWIRTFEEGVWLYDEGDLKHISVLEGLAHNNVREIFEDKYGNIWLGTLDGVSKYGRVIFEIFDMDLGLPENPVTSVFIDSKKRIWFGTYGSMLFMDPKETNILSRLNEFPPHAMALCFAENKKGKLYIGTDVGLYSYDEGSFEKLFIDREKEERMVNSLLFVSEDYLWCGTDSGIVVLQGEKLHAYKSIKQGFVNPQVNSIAQYKDRICCATEGGVSLFTTSGHHLANYTTEDGLASNVCIDVTYDEEGNMWVATNKGLCKIRLDPSTGIDIYTTQDGLTSNTIYFVEFSDEQHVWVGTERGMNVLNTRTGQIESYGYEDGFYPLETNARAISKGDKSDLWIGTVGGLVHYLPEYDIKDPYPPDLLLFPPVVNGEVLVSQNQKPELPHKKNTLEFRFTGIHTTSPSQNSFSYFLEGYDENWSARGGDRVALYKKIPSGSYTFRVKAYNLDGVVVEKEATFPFTIRPPFWRTPWFVILEVFFGMMLVYTYIKYRERQLVHEKRILETRVKERTREIEDQKVEIEAQRDQIVEQKRFVENQRDQIFLQNKEITDSIHYARRIQQAVLPGKHLLDRFLPEHFIMLNPRDIVSGDFYWIEEKDGLIIVCAADCTGHGVPGAFMSLLGLTFLNEIVNKDGILQAGEILNKLRSYIIAALSNEDESNEAKDGMDLSLVVIDREKHGLEFAGAYNPLILIRDGEIVEYKADKMPIGKHIGHENPFSTHLIELKDRDMIYLYSDGYQDQFGGEKDSKYKARPFKSLLQKVSSKPAEEQIMLLNRELERWKGEAEQVDDILVVGIRYTE